MTKRIYTSIVCSLLLVFFMLLFSKCKKDDTTPPVITLNNINDTLITIELGGTYTPPGVSATDNKDGNIPANKIIITGLDNVKKDAAGHIIEAGEFIIGYHVQDAAGNSALELISKLHVRTDSLAGTYKITEIDTINKNQVSYTINVSQSPTIFNELIINKLRNMTDTIKVIVNQKFAAIPFQTFNANASIDSIVGDSGIYNGSPTNSSSNITDRFSLKTLRYTLRTKGLNDYYLANLVKTSSTITTHLILPKKQQPMKQQIIKSIINQPKPKGQAFKKL